jgi:hypothetical protein
MEATITQNGALYALQHGAPKKYLRVRQKRMAADLIRSLPTLTTFLEKFTTRQIPSEKARFALQNNGAQVTVAFPEYRAA